MSSLQDKRWVCLWLENGCLAKFIVALSSVLFPNESSESAGLLCVAVRFVHRTEIPAEGSCKDRSSACSACRVLSPGQAPPPCQIVPPLLSPEASAPVSSQQGMFSPKSTVEATGFFERLLKETY